MALNEEIRRQRKKLKGKGVKAHLQWFWDYEKLPTIIVGVVAAILIALIVQWVTYKPYAFGVLFLNANVTDPEESETLETDFMQYADIDSSQYQAFMDLDETLPVGEYSMDQTVVVTQQKVMAELAANQIDVAVMDPVNFETYLNSELFRDLRETLDAETLEKYRDRIYYADRTAVEKAEEESDSAAADETAEMDSTQTYQEWQEEQDRRAKKIQSTELVENFTLPDPSAMDDPVPVGILVNDAPFFKENHNFEKTAALIGFVSNGAHPEYAQAFLEYLFEK